VRAGDQYKAIALSFEWALPWPLLATKRPVEQKLPDELING
jgi:hypothetical protein